MMQSERREAEADRPAENDEHPAAAARQNVVKEGNRRDRRGWTVEADIEEVRRLDPGGENDKQQKPQREDRGKGRRAQRPESVTPRSGEPELAAASHLIKADREERAHQRKSGGERKRQVQRIRKRTH